MAHAKKDNENPHFRSRDADLAAIWDACRGALTAHGLAVVQSPRLVSVGEAAWMVEVETTLFHASGQSLGDVLAVPVNPANAQVVGSAITYARRYALASFVGVAPADDDDDGQAASPAPATREALPAGAMESITVRVLGIVKRPLADGKERYVISASDQHTYATFRLEHATAAKAAQEAGAPIEITYKTTNNGRDIAALRELEQEPCSMTPIRTLLTIAIAVLATGCEGPHPPADDADGYRRDQTPAPVLRCRVPRRRRSAAGHRRRQ